MGYVMLFFVIMTVFSVFTSVLAFVALIKTLQIAEDLRYLRSKSDIHVQRPKPHMNTVIVCLIVSLILLVLVIALLLSIGTPSHGISAISTSGSPLFTSR